MSASIQGLGTPISPEVATPARSAASGNNSDFAQVLRDGMRQVDQLQSEAQQKTGELLTGNGQDVHAAMIAAQKADLSFQLMMQVRNKIVSAYQEISRMNF